MDRGSGLHIATEQMIWAVTRRGARWDWGSSIVTAPERRARGRSPPPPLLLGSCGHLAEPQQGL